MTSLNKTARIAGLLYLLVVFTGPFVLLYVPGKLFVSGDASATAANILANEGLYRAYVAVGIASQLLFIATVLALYRLLEGVNRPVAAVMVLLIMLDSPIAFQGIANQVATLSFLRGGEFLAPFDRPQHEALSLLLVTAEAKGVFVSELFWGLWLLPLGWLVIRSGFLPRFIGYWLYLNGAAYIAMAFSGILAPQFLETITTFSMPVLFGEVALTLWLLARGVRPSPEPSPAPSQ